jgi:hypothetical protein
MILVKISRIIFNFNLCFLNTYFFLQPTELIQFYQFYYFLIEKYMGSPCIRDSTAYVRLSHANCPISVEATFPRDGQTIGSHARPHYELF